MDRLKDIKEAFNSSVTRESGFTQKFIDDINWLIEQAEEVEVLERRLENTIFTDTYGEPIPKRTFSLETVNLNITNRGRLPIPPERDY